MRERINKLFQEIEALLADPARRDCALPEETYFLGDDAILCPAHRYGDSRYPYVTDGFCLWAYRSGYLAANESAFTVFPFADDGKQPYLAFFAGIKEPDGEFTPVSLTGVAAQSREEARRYTVFTPAAAYYLTEVRGFRFALRITVNESKRIEATLYAFNASGACADIYFSTYANCLLKFARVEDTETKWFKSCRATDQGFLFDSVIDLSRDKHVDYYGVITSRVEGDAYARCVTTSRADFAGGKSVPLNCAEPLFTGRFASEQKACMFTDTAVAGEIVHFHLAAGAHCSEQVGFGVTKDAETAKEWSERGLSAGEFDGTIAAKERRDARKNASDGMIGVEFGQFTDGEINCRVFNRFVSSVVRQVEYCAFTKTSSESMLGVRDVFQQLEAALMWNRSDCRAKMREALDFIGTDGRAPRQYSLPAEKGCLPLLDLRAFIDQGLWIVDAVYTYLAYTGDDKFLYETCGYYVYEGNRASLTEERDDVLTHLERIVDYLLSKIDKETNCLRILYGDWNDALDGLGVSMDGSCEYGSGVSVMATLQLCAALREMSEILSSRGLRLDLVARYRREYDRLKDGLQKNAVVQDVSGERRIVHGWGDRKSYYAGSFCDADNVSRDGLAANAFWVIAGAYEWDRSIKADLLASFARLDSKYGLRTFRPHFEKGTRGFGRIPNLPQGTAENGATYAHATLFGIWALFLLGEEREAWAQLYKILPQTHAHISTSPFVMPNSYVYNEEFGMDGESMNDWYTGSAAVLIKVLTRCVFGVNLTQAALTVNPARNLPCKHAELNIKVRDTAVTVLLRSDGGPARSIRVNGEAVSGDALLIPFERLGEQLRVEITN